LGLQKSPAKLRHSVARSGRLVKSLQNQRLAEGGDDGGIATAEGWSKTYVM
jgi:hypothetical protein